MYKIVFYTKYDSNGASSRYRTLIYLQSIGQIHRYKRRYLFSNNYLLFKFSGMMIYHIVVWSYVKRFVNLISDVFYFDIFVIEKEIFPYFPRFGERLIKFFGKKLVMDIDDGLWVNSLSKNKWMKTYNDAIWKASMLLPDRIIVGGKMIEGFVRNYRKTDIYVLPTVENIEIKAQDNFDSKIIGWIGSQSTSSRLDLVLPELFPYCERSGAQIFALGYSGKYSERDYFRILTWSQDAVRPFLERITVGIMPLYGSEFERFKCGFKIVQYFTAGVPAVASNWGENNYIVRDGINGYLSNNFVKELERILTDRNLYDVLCEGARETYLSNYNYNLTKEMYSSIVGVW